MDCPNCGKSYKQKKSYEKHIEKCVPPEQQLENLSLEHQFTFIDLFCGIGGFHQALKKHGGKCVFASDMDKKCQQIYEQNYQIKPAGDIKKVDEKELPDFDVLTGGFPCPSFSNGGKKLGMEDDRGKLFNDIIRIAKEKKPKLMLLENVKHIKKVNDGEVFDYILKTLDETGYRTITKEISPHQLGIPQQRERIIFICSRKDLPEPNPNLEIPNHELNYEQILEENPDAKYNISEEVKEVLTAWDEMISKFETNEVLSPTILVNEFYNKYTKKEFEKLPSWKRDYITKNKRLYDKYKKDWDEWYLKYKNILQKREIYGRLEWQTGKKKENDSIWNYFIQLRQSGIRVKRAEYFPTLVAIVQTPIYGKGKRYITPRECARLQSFPDNFEMHPTDQIAYKQFGNAVNVEVVNFVLTRILECWDVLF